MTSAPLLPLLLSTLLHVATRLGARAARLGWIAVFVGLGSALVPSSAAAAPSVRWVPASATLGLSQTSELQLLFEDCGPEEAPTLPTVDGLSISQPPSMSQETQIINMSMTRRVRLTYAVRPTARRTLRIPEFEVRTDKGPMRVASVSFEVGEATLGGTGITLKDAATSRFTVPVPPVWAGEVFPLTYTLQLARRYYHSLGGHPEWNSAPLLTEEWAKPEPIETRLRGEPAIDVVYRTRALARQPGPVQLNASTQLVNLVTNALITSPFQRTQLDQYAVPSDQPMLRVRDLPKPAPATFAGAVGQFQLTSQIVPLTAQVGEPITWTLTLTGTGNWPDLKSLPPREASRDFRVVQPQAKRDTPPGALFDATLTEDVVLVPTRAGSYTLGPVTWSYFDPAKGAYETVTTERVTVTIDAPTLSPVAPATAASGATPPASGTDAATAARDALPKPAAPAPPSALPRDPLPGSAAAVTPLPTRTFVWSLVAAAVLWIPGWIVLAWRHARATDPARPRREAATRLAATVAQLRIAAPGPAGATAPSTVDSPLADLTARLLRDWQRDTTVLFQLPTAAPRAAQLPDAAWATLWRESERALYAAGGALPADWAARATAALAAHRVPGLPPFAWLLPRNLLPFVATLALLALALPPLLSAAEPAKPAPAPASSTVTAPAAAPSAGTAAPRDPIADYQAGRFAAAGRSWREQLAATPTDAFAHHNLALALAQQNQLGEAAAHWVAATVQAPDEESIRWHLDYVFARAGFTVPEAQSLARNGPREWLARLATPGAWQRILIGATATLSLALSLLLWGAYTPRRTAAPAAALAVLALLTLALGGIALHRYGTLAEPRAALVWKPSLLRSVPTEADLTQQTTALSPGTLVVIDKEILTWRRLVLPGGQTGWTTAETLLPLWQ